MCGIEKSNLCGHRFSLITVLKYFVCPPPVLIKYSDDPKIYSPIFTGHIVTSACNNFLYKSDYLKRFRINLDVFLLPLNRRNLIKYILH